MSIEILRKIAELEAEAKQQREEIGRLGKNVEAIASKVAAVDERLARMEIRAQERDRAYRVLAAVLGAVGATIVWLSDLGFRIINWLHAGKGQ